MKANVLIPTSAKIGYGFYIGHGICITVNKGTIIGNNVNLTQFLNIGTNHNTPAIIGDNVYIGPQVCIVEDVKIGNNSSIGAGAIVTKDIPENATAVGVPAKVLNFNDPGRFVKRRWPMPGSMPRKTVSRTLSFSQGRQKPSCRIFTVRESFRPM